ncbi:hypothetical protein BT96DRAFT_17457 [Gymnopus androsaceus JB14]|uniref:BHLH domain-containing protein n=1 Tax=Gymnopus androsaceus JB14 TaxID=1447944 RepID=A0A6A4ILR3_9AGAR|nr:hypothetical protein BT96DRAFT_17457 [Gymnopus androsaceus JB14]
MQNNDISASPSSTDDSSRTTSSTTVDPASDNSSTTGKKRKQIRRVNSTAERRATHNAVERQRRETLNERFLDLAAILPNLSQIRRPSKSAIVKSSIAYFHASRRHRLVASRELRLLKFETDALRRELNDWRDRASIRRVQEPTRSDGFTLVLSGELEILRVDGLDDEDFDEGENDLYTPVVPPDDSFEHPFDAPSIASGRNDMRPPQISHNLIPPYPTQRQMIGGPMPMIASPRCMVVENPTADMPFNAMNFHEMEQGMQNKWAGPDHVNDQAFLGAFERQKLSSEREHGHEDRKATPKGLAGQPLQYFDPGYTSGNWYSEQ